MPKPSQSDSETPEEVPLDEASPSEVRRRCVDFLNREAELLDGWEMRAWYDLVTEDVRYRVPLRVTKERGANEFSETATHFEETHDSLDMRVRRFESEYAWSENPPSRVRHFVTNVRVDSVEGDEVDVRSYLLLHRTQHDQTNYDLISCEREDTLREVDGHLRLARREVFLDHTVVDIEYFSTML